MNPILSLSAVEELPVNRGDGPTYQGSIHAYATTPAEAKRALRSVGQVRFSESHKAGGSKLDPLQGHAYVSFQGATRAELDAVKRDMDVFVVLRGKGKSEREAAHIAAERMPFSYPTLPMWRAAADAVWRDRGGFGGPIGEWALERIAMGTMKCEDKTVEALAFDLMKEENARRTKLR